MQFVGQFDTAGTPGLFGPSLPVDGGVASVFDRVLARSGRRSGVVNRLTPRVGSEEGVLLERRAASACAPARRRSR